MNPTEKTTKRMCNVVCDNADTGEHIYKISPCPYNWSIIKPVMETILCIKNIKPQNITISVVNDAGSHDVIHMVWNGETLKDSVNIKPKNKKFLFTAYGKHRWKRIMEQVEFPASTIAEVDSYMNKWASENGITTEEYTTDWNTDDATMAMLSSQDRNPMYATEAQTRNFIHDLKGSFGVVDDVSVSLATIELVMGLSHDIVKSYCDCAVMYNLGVLIGDLFVVF